MDWRNILRSIERRQDLEENKTTLWTTRCRAFKLDQLSQEMKDVVLSFWTFHSTVSPNQKDITRQQIGVKVFEEHPKHYLQVSQVCVTLTLKHFFSSLMLL